MLYLLELQEKLHRFHMTQHSDSALQPQHTYFLKGNAAFKRINLNYLEHKEVERMKAVFLNLLRLMSLLHQKPKC